MAFDGNGNWVSQFSAVADRDAGIAILASRFDNIFISDIAQSFENCLTKDAQVKPQQDFDANSHKVINVANPTASGDAVNYGTLTTGNINFTGNINLGSYATATTPATSNNSTAVSTTAWFNAKIKVVSTLPATPDSNVYYFVTG